MREVLNREQTQHFDQDVAARGVPSLLLMENAGRGAADFLIAERADWLRGTLLVVAGPGNNGGDGWVVARRLLTMGYRVEVASQVDPSLLKGDARHMFLAYGACGGIWWVLRDAPLSDQTAERRQLRDDEYSLIIDALWGTGLNRDLDDEASGLVSYINKLSLPVVALDLPSGLDADTGMLRGACIRAKLTLTFAWEKLGLLTPNGHEYAGNCHVIDIGVPASTAHFVSHKSFPSALRVEASDIAAWLNKRGEPRHKGAAGRVLIVAGSAGASGAARLCALAAQRSGAGLVTLGARPEIAADLNRDLWEGLLCSIEPEHILGSLQDVLQKSHCVALGPGIGLDALGERIVRGLVTGHAGRLVLDADALTHYAGRAAQLKNAPGQLMLTPHPTEAARLLGVDTAAVEADRFRAVQHLCELTGAAVLLKGRCTLLCAPGQRPWIVDRGSSVLATAGSGDVLSGITAALACHLEPLTALTCAAWLHACAGERAAERAPLGVLARELADWVPTLWGELLEG